VAGAAGIALVLINRQDKLNVLSGTVAAQLEDALAWSATSSIRAAIVTGLGERHSPLAPTLRISRSLRRCRGHVDDALIPGRAFGPALMATRFDDNGPGGQSDR
jgi:hypothetical protein